MKGIKEGGGEEAEENTTKKFVPQTDYLILKKTIL